MDEFCKNITISFVIYCEFETYWDCPRGIFYSFLLGEKTYSAELISEIVLQKL